MELDPLTRCCKVPRTWTHSTLTPLKSVLLTSHEWMGRLARAIILLEGGVSPWQLASSLTSRLDCQGTLSLQDRAFFTTTRSPLRPFRSESVLLSFCLFVFPAYLLISLFMQFMSVLSLVNLHFIFLSDVFFFSNVKNIYMAIVFSKNRYQMTAFVQNVW